MKGINVSFSHFRYTCINDYTFSDGTTEKNITCQDSSNGTGVWSDINDECRERMCAEPMFSSSTISGVRDIELMLYLKCMIYNQFTVF